MIFSSIENWPNWIKMLLLVVMTALLLAFAALGFNFLMELLF